MRILLAVDGSTSADRAADLVAALTLPPKTLVRIVAVQGRHVDVLGITWGDANPGVESEAQTDARHGREIVERVERRIARPGLIVEAFVLRGRPGSEIVDEARSMGADLVVVGSRGHGTFATMLLGSTAAEVVDHAPCPVLVARSAELGSIVFADDGSPSARAAEGLLATSPLFAGHEVTVVTVADTALPVMPSFVAAGMEDAALEQYTLSVGDARSAAHDEAERSAGRLVDAGLRAAPVPLDGDAAAGIVRYAAATGAATIVLGTRGHTGLARLLLGSVARNVLLHAPCSVLVVRAPRADPR